MYADDGMFRFSSNSRDKNQDKLDQNFWKLKNFLDANGLKMNESKTKLTEFMTRQKRVKTRGIPPDLTVREETRDKRGRLSQQDRLISDKGKCKILGITLQNSLNWEKHLTDKGALLPKVRSLLGRIYKIGQNTSMKVRLRLVNSLVLSKLSYGLCLWGNTSNNQRQKVQTTINIAARIITRKGKLTRQEDLLKEVDWLNIQNWTEQVSMIQMWKILRWKIPQNMTEDLTLNGEDRIVTDPPRLLLTEQSFKYVSIQNWNLLPDYMRGEQSLVRFKRQIRTWLRERPLDPDPDE